MAAWTFDDADRRRPRRRTAARLLAGALSLAAHGAMLLLILSSARTMSVLARPIEPMPVELVRAPDIAPAPTASSAPSAAAAPSTAKPGSRAQTAKASAATRHVEPVAVELSGNSSVGLSDSDLAGAAVAGSAVGAGTCNMIARLQSALRKDPLVRAAAAQAGAAGNHAIFVWNGDWIQSDGEDGKGLSAAREAILWEVGFAPAACRAQPVRGLVLLSMNESPGSAKLVLGAGAWRWSDLLATRR